MLKQIHLEYKLIFAVSNFLYSLLYCTLGRLWWISTDVKLCISVLVFTLYISVLKVLQEKHYICLMDINHNAQEGLQLCGESVRVSNKSFKKLTELTIDILLGKREEECLDSKCSSSASSSSSWRVISYMHFNFTPRLS